MNHIFLSVIIPAHNESSRIGKTLERIASYFKTVSYAYEVIVVDDGSSDGTDSICAAFQTDLPQLRTLRNSSNRGKGYSVRRGMQETSGTFKLFMDADGSVDISHLDAFLSCAESGFDVVIGSIGLDGSIAIDQNRLYRRIFHTLSKILIRIIAATGVSDTQRGFKLFSRRAADAIFAKQTIERFGFDIELLVLAKKHHFSLKEMPVTWINSSGSTVTLMSYWKTLRELFTIKSNSIFSKYD